jgi:hypothetical protein
MASGEREEVKQMLKLDVADEATLRRMCESVGLAWIDVATARTALLDWFVDRNIIVPFGFIFLGPPLPRETMSSGNLSLIARSLGVPAYNFGTTIYESKADTGDENKETILPLATIGLAELHTEQQLTDARASALSVCVEVLTNTSKRKCNERLRTLVADKTLLKRALEEFCAARQS